MQISWDMTTHIWCHCNEIPHHYTDVIISAIASQITSLTIVYSTVYSGADQRKHQSSASLAFVWGIHRWPVNCPHKGSVTRKMFPLDDVIMYFALLGVIIFHLFGKNARVLAASARCVIYLSLSVLMPEYCDIAWLLPWLLVIWRLGSPGH